VEITIATLLPTQQRLALSEADFVVTFVLREGRENVLRQESVLQVEKNSGRAEIHKEPHRKSAVPALNFQTRIEAELFCMSYNCTKLQGDYRSRAFLPQREWSPRAVAILVVMTLTLQASLAWIPALQF
jgi:hypothetical protein